MFTYVLSTLAELLALRHTNISESAKSYEYPQINQALQNTNMYNPLELLST